MNARKQKDIRVILHDIRSTGNVGSIFRTADALGVLKIYLSGYTPAPEDRFGRNRTDIAKVSLGAEKNVSWEQTKNISTLVRKLQREGFEIIALEQDEYSTDYKKVKVGGKVVIIVGNEVTGISRTVLDMCDVIAEIAMRGKKESLNVSVAFGIALARILNL